jgi:hypothetical protein
MENNEKLEMLNRFTRREHTEDEVYIFDVVLCDNEVDRDYERFSLEALKTLQQLFIGKTGIFDHDAKSSGQTARIFYTELFEDPEKKTSAGENYTCLKACAYMVRTGSNENLIKEIDGGIKKEVSVSCSAAVMKCSICGADRKKKNCPHVKGKEYNGKKAHVILDNITDAYEWSFVAVPAQINAGVTRKHFSQGSQTVETTAEISVETVEKLCGNLKKDVLRLCFLAGENSKILKSAADRMTLSELVDFKEELEKKCKKSSTPQLLNDSSDDMGKFRMTGGK